LPLEKGEQGIVVGFEVLTEVVMKSASSGIYVKDYTALYPRRLLLFKNLVDFLVGSMKIVRSVLCLALWSLIFL
jgi:hypothetical protein